jgi:hypothetical protein
MNEKRKFDCPVTEDKCITGGCTVGRCRRLEREEDAFLRAKAEKARAEWDHSFVIDICLDL